VDGDGLPPNVRVGSGSHVVGYWHKFHSRREPAVVVGEHSTIDSTHFSLGPDGFVEVGDHCYLSSVLLMAELEIRIGNFVLLGWNVAIADSDFHPLDPALRIQDTIANSIHRLGTQRPAFTCRPVVIEDDVAVGPNTLILKGVRVGAGSVIEAGSLLTEDVPPRSRIAGNPAAVVGSV
jgi:acetyltransferase-like isoleucine patch superfamily enzyme